MTGALEATGVLAERNGESDPAWLREAREQARRRFAALGYPTTRDENWKYTNVAAIAKTQFQAGPYRFDDQIAELVESVALAGTISLVFINGRYCRELSNHQVLPDGLKVDSLRTVLKRRGDQAESYFAADRREADAAFVALNTASFEDGAFVEVADGLVLDTPIHLVFVSASGERPTASHPRNLILAGALSQASMIETYAGFEDTVYFTNTVTDVIAGENSTIDYLKVQKESVRSFHVASLRFEQSRQSNVACRSFSFGGGLVRNDINLTLAEGAEGTLNGLYLAAGKQHVDNHTSIDHAKPHGASRELYKGILDGHASAVFNGKVIVRKDAQKTDAKQTNRNLLLSEEAVINTKPELQIHADDVRCTHGATIGQLDGNALFYLRSRGIGQKEARQILIRAFADEIIGGIKHPDLRDRLGSELDARLKTGGGEDS